MPLAGQGGEDGCRCLDSDAPGDGVRGSAHGSGPQHGRARGPARRRGPGGDDGRRDEHKTYGEQDPPPSRHPGRTLLGEGGVRHCKRGARALPLTVRRGYAAPKREVDGERWVTVLRCVFGSADWSTNHRGWSRAVLALLVPRRAVAGARRPGAGVGVAPAAGRCGRRGRPSRPAPVASRGREQYRDDRYGLVPRAERDGIHRRPRLLLRPSLNGYPTSNPSTGFTRQGRGVRRRHPWRAARTAARL